MMQRDPAEKIGSRYLMKDEPFKRVFRVKGVWGVSWETIMYQSKNETGQ